MVFRTRKDRDPHSCPISHSSASRLEPIATLKVRRGPSVLSLPPRTIVWGGKPTQQSHQIIPLLCFTPLVLKREKLPLMIFVVRTRHHSRSFRACEGCEAPAGEFDPRWSERAESVALLLLMRSWNIEHGMRRPHRSYLNSDDYVASARTFVIASERAGSRGYVCCAMMRLLLG